MAAARSQFSNVGYDGATIRSIAAASHVDGKLVLHYFKSKEGLFRAVVDFPFDPSQAIPAVLQPGIEGLGMRLAQFFLDLWDQPRGGGVALVRSAVANENAAAMLRDFVSREILARIAKSLELDQPKVRASLAGSQLVGIAMLRYIVKVEPLASAPSAKVAAWIGPTLQRYFTDPAVTHRASAHNEPRGRRVQQRRRQTVAPGGTQQNDQRR